MRRQRFFMCLRSIALVIGVCALIIHVAPNAVAGERVNVGFTTDEALESLICGEAWQYTEMGTVFWPLVYDQLWILGPPPDYAPLPRLAKRWETKDNKTWRFYLYKGATFHDGTPLTAADVAFTLENLPGADPAWEYPDTDFESVSVVDDYTVEFTLSAEHGGAYPPVFWVPILPKHIWEPYKDDMVSFENLKAIGSGPYKLKEFKAEEFIWLEANRDYWGTKPQVDEVVFKSYGSQDALNMALKKGQIDMIGYNGISALAVDDFRKAKDIRVIVTPGIGLIWLSFNLHKETPIRDLNVRKAIMHGIDRDRIIRMVYIMHGIDRDRIIRMVYRGYAVAANSFIYPELPEYNPDVPKYLFMPDTAKKILRDAGYVDKNGDGIRNDPATGKNLTFEFMVPSDWTDELKTVKIIKEQMKDIGIEISMKVVDPADDKFDISLGEEEPGPHADWIWEFCRSYNEGGEGWNQAYYNNAKFDELLDKMTAEADLEKRKKYLIEMQKIVAEDLPYGMLLRPDMIDPVRADRFEGYVETMGGVSTWINPWTYFGIRPK
jgi:peptide/nickel transport system substrate-binding protein